MFRVKNDKLSLFPLIALSIGSMIATGVFGLSSDMANAAGAGGQIIGWLITSVGIMALAMVFKNLSIQRPGVYGGIFGYAKEGFGNYIGFTIGWGYWICTILGDVAFYIMLFKCIGYFFPPFLKFNSPLTFICASLVVWVVCFLILRGVKIAAGFNSITTVGKLIPIALFIILAIIMFKAPNFTSNFWGNKTPQLGSVMNQVKNTMLITLWVFTGVESVAILSRRAKKMADVGRATITGLLIVMVIYVLVSLLSLGVMENSKLQALETPSMAYLLQFMVGKWGAVLINLGLIVSLAGAMVTWTLIAAEIPAVAADSGVFMKSFGRANENAAPSGAVIWTSLITQLVLVLVYFSNSTYQVMYSVSTAGMLIPYLTSGAYAFKVAIEGGESGKEAVKGFRTIAVVSIIYSLWVVFAAGVNYIALVFIMYAIGVPFYIYTMKSRKQHAFKRYELILAAVLVVFGIIAAIMAAAGHLSLS